MSEEEDIEKIEKRIEGYHLEERAKNTKIETKEEIILKRLEKAEKELSELKSQGKENKGGDDDECCPECGGKTTEILKDIYQCNKCGERFEDV